MINNPNSITKINLIITQLAELRTLINDSIDHSQQIAHSYPRTSQIYNSILRQLEELGEKEINSILTTFEKVEEKAFVPSESYQHAVNLLQDVKLLHSVLIKLNYQNEVTKTIHSSCGALGNAECNQTGLITKSYSDKNIFLDIPFTEYEDREAILRDVLKRAGLEAIVAKDRLTSNIILCKVCKHIQFCKYGIADISFGRHSVSYELGLMHGFDKKVCILLQEDSDKFSDILGLEHVDYKGKKELSIKLSKWLLENVIEANKEELRKYIKEQEQLLKEKGEVTFGSPPLKKSSEGSLESIFKDPKAEVEILQLIDRESEQLTDYITKTLEGIEDTKYDSLWNGFVTIFRYSYSYLLLIEKITKYRNDLWEPATRIFEHLRSLNKDGDRNGKYGLINYVFYCLLEIMGAINIENGKFALLRAMLEINRLKKYGDGIEDILHWDTWADFIQEKNESERNKEGQKWIFPRFQYLLDIINAPDFPIKFDLKTKLIETDLLYFVFSVKEANDPSNPWFPCSPVYSTDGAPPLFKKIKYDDKFGGIVAKQLFDVDYKALLDILRRAKEIINTRLRSAYLDSFGAEEVLNDF